MHPVGTWTAQEDAAIRAAYGLRPRPRGTVNRLVRQLGRPLTCVQTRARQLGVYTPVCTRFWTPERDAVLREWCGLATAAELAERLGSTQAAVFSRMGFLGLKRHAVNRQRYVTMRAALDSAADSDTVRRLRLLLAYKSGALSLAETATALGLTPEATHKLAVTEMLAGARLAQPQERAS